jgi:hypothetical protein
MRHRLSGLWPALLAAAWLLLFFAPLVRSGQALANRDIPLFHLPLRSAFRGLAAFGLPTWNPWLHGGQPVLSNPSYAAFYPPSWLVFVAPPDQALDLLVLLHGAIAFAGAWRLARHFGCGRGAAALAAIGYSGCGAYVSLLSAFTLFCSMAWFPWVLAWGDAALRGPARERWRRPALLAGGALGLQLLNGEPTTVLMSGLGLLALAASAGARRPAAVWRAAVPVAFAVALAAVQILPTLGRMGDSPRKALPSWHANLWSMPPARFAELVHPRAFGDPARQAEGIFFGWGIFDRDYPYIESIYPGLLLALLGVAALIRWPIPRRAGWALVVAGGFFLALGRFNPLYEGFRRAIPVLAILRFPEKFAVLAVPALGLAGVLGWQRLLDERQAGRRGAADFPLALALVTLAAALVLAAVLTLQPRVGAWFVATHGAPDLDPATRAASLRYYLGETWATVATAAGVALLLALCRWRVPSRRLLEGSAVALLGFDLWRCGHGLVRTLPASFYRQPPPLAASLLPPRDRIFVQPAVTGELAYMPRGWGDPRTLLTRTDLARLSPYAGLLWRIPYVFETDFDLTLTPWARRSDDILREEWRRPENAYRFLGVWNAGTLLLRRTREEQPPAAPDPPSAVLRKVPNPYVLPRFRFVPRVGFHPDHRSALAAARAAGWKVQQGEHCVRAGAPGTVAYPSPPEVLSIADEGGRIELRYRAAAGAFFVAATTYDRGWRATLDGRPLRVDPTAACQLGLQLPAGQHRLELRYREPLLPLGLAVTLAALAGGAAAIFLPGRGRRVA